MILRIILFNELEDFLPQGAVRRRPKKVPLSFSALARGALQAPGCAEDRHSPPAGPPEGRRRQWCARRNDANKFLLFDVESRNHFTKMSNLAKFYEKTSNLAIAPSHRPLLLNPFTHVDQVRVEVESSEGAELSFDSPVDSHLPAQGEAHTWRHSYS